MRPKTSRSHPTCCIVQPNDHIMALLGCWSPRKGEQTRQEIVRKAALIFNQKDMIAQRFPISCERPG
jgi:hypothetical protein